VTRSSLSRIGGALLAAALACAPRAVLGQERPQDAYDDEAPLDPGAGTPRPAAPDWRSGTLLLSAGGGYSVPLGSFASGITAGERVSGGPAVNGALGFGLSRNTSFQIQGTYGWFSGTEACPSCTGNSLGVGLGLTYHLVQGIAFDPWGSVGVGYRTINITVPVTAGGVEALTGGGRYHGIDFARVAFGGDFYPHPAFGIGPYVEGAFGSFRLRPVESQPSIYAFVQVGLRFVLDPLRSGRVTPQRATARAY
jgi:hypothetical protein